MNLLYVRDGVSQCIASARCGVSQAGATVALLKSAQAVVDDGVKSTIIMLGVSVCIPLHQLCTQVVTDVEPGPAMQSGISVPVRIAAGVYHMSVKTFGFRSGGGEIKISSIVARTQIAAVAV